MSSLRKTKNKYNNKPTKVDGITFDSAKEAKRYQELKLLERAKEIVWIELQPRFPVTINGKKVFEYRADFLYLTKDGKRILEDVKGMRTPLYRLKKKCVEAFYGVTITEI